MRKEVNPRNEPCRFFPLNMKSIQLKKLTLDPAATQKRLDDGRGEAAAIIEAMRQNGVTVKLFGSMNTGKAFPNSDIDLLVNDCVPLSPEDVLVEIHAIE